MDRRHAASLLARSLASVTCVALASAACAAPATPGVAPPRDRSVAPGSDRSVPGLPTQVGVCDDLLVTHRPDGSTGATDAVTITSQAIERGVEGWAMVGWRAAGDTSLREVQIVDADGVSTQPGAAQGVAGPASEIRFCGTVTRETTSDDVVSDGAATELGGAAPGAARSRSAASSATPGGSDRTTALSSLGGTVGPPGGSVVLGMSRSGRRSGGGTP